MFTMLMRKTMSPSERRRPPRKEWAGTPRRQQVTATIQPGKKNMKRAATEPTTPTTSLIPCWNEATTTVSRNQSGVTVRRNLSESGERG